MNDFLLFWLFIIVGFIVLIYGRYISCPKDSSYCSNCERCVSKKAKKCNHCGYEFSGEVVYEKKEK